MLGDREKVPVELIDSFMQTGTIHFLAISGLHVGILVVSLHYFLRLLRFNMKTLAIIIILITFLYAAITGLKTPIIRASIMVATYYGAFIVNRRWDLSNSIVAAVFIILLINPSDLFNVGFQLSVLAVLGIVYISNQIESKVISGNQPSWWRNCKRKKKGTRYGFYLKYIVEKHFVSL